MTDRTAYISFLEVQLERVSSACLTVQGFADRIQQLHNNFQRMDEKIQSLGRALHMSTGVVDKQEAEFEATRGRLSFLERQNTKSMSDVQILSKDVSDVHKTIKSAVKEEFQDIKCDVHKLQSKVMTMVEKELDRRYRRAEDRLSTELERKFLKQEKAHQENDSEAFTAVCHLVKNIDKELRDKVSTLEHQLMNEQPEIVAELLKGSIPASPDDLNNLNRKIHRSDQVNSKIARDMLSKMASLKKDIQGELESHGQQVEEKVCKLLLKTANKQERQTQESRNYINQQLKQLRIDILNDTKPQLRQNLAFEQEQVNTQVERLVDRQLQEVARETEQEIIKKDIERLYEKLTNMEYEKLLKKKKTKKKKVRGGKPKRKKILITRVKRRKKGTKNLKRRG